MDEQIVKDFIQKLPKAELHLHLEGTILPPTLVELSKRHDSEPLSLEQATALFQYTDFTTFIEAFTAVTERLKTPDDYELIGRKMLERLHEQGVTHAEVFISVGVTFEFKKCTYESFDNYFIALERARIYGEKELGVSVLWIFDATRNFSFQQAEQVVHKAIDLHSTYPSIIGIGLGGDERHTASDPFRELFALAGKAGLRLSNHAGETTGPEAIWEALSIGSERLGHVYSAYQDITLLNELKTRRIPVEMNPTSNVRLFVCPCLEQHPIRALFDHGLLVTLNSDDPGFFGADIAAEYYNVHTALQFTLTELQLLARNSFEGSFLSDTMKKTWMDRVMEMPIPSLSSL